VGNEKIKILVCCYQPWALPKEDIYAPVQAGRAVSGFALNMQGDDAGDNISSRNATFSEFTAWYWAWKNIKTLYPDLEYIGLSHYRRYFCLKPPDAETPIYYTTAVPEMKDYGDICIRLLQHADIILCMPGYLGVSLKTHYARWHYAKEYFCMKNIVHDLYPEYAASFETVFETHGHMSPFCIFITKYTFFDLFFHWLFPLLFEAEKRIDVSKYSPYQKRCLAFLAERMLNVYIYHNNTKVEYAPIYFIMKPVELVQFKVKKFIKNFIPYGILKMRDEKRARR
jgi:hypothetical protein